MNKPRGFTLIELLVVLAILVALTAVAATSLEGVQDQSRFDMTTRQMNEIRDAMIGSNTLRQVDGTPILNGYVADIGALPATLDDLWKAPTTAGAQYSVVQVKADVSAYVTTTSVPLSVNVSRGWRSILRMGAGQTKLSDGWGNDFSYNVTNDPAVITSQGPDLTQTADDLTVNIPSTSYLVSSVSFPVHVKTASSNNNPYKLCAAIYGPDPDQSNPAVRIWYQEISFTSPGDGSVANFNFAIDGTTQTTTSSPPTQQFLYTIATQMSSGPLAQPQFKNMTAGSRVLWLRVENTSNAIKSWITPLNFQALPGVVTLGPVNIEVGP